MFTTNTDRSIYGVRKASPTIVFSIHRHTDINKQAEGGNHGIIVVKTVKTFIVAEYAPPIQAAEATPVVEGVADYLISTSY